MLMVGLRLKTICNLDFNPNSVRSSWDEAGVGGPVVRCYVGDNEQRWFMWYSGRGAGSPDLDALLPASGSVGAHCWMKSCEIDLFIDSKSNCVVD